MDTVLKKDSEPACAGIPTTERSCIPPYEERVGIAQHCAHRELYEASEHRYVEREREFVALQAQFDAKLREAESKRDEALTAMRDVLSYSKCPPTIEENARELLKESK